MKYSYDKLKWTAYVFFIIIITVCGGCLRSSGTTQRPKDFPGVIITPPNACNVRYLVHENKSGAGSDASVIFSVKEPYPAKTVLEFFENHFREVGWVQLRHDPRYPLKFPLKGIPSQFNKWESVEMRGDIKEVHRIIKEYWADPCTNDSVYFSLVYASPIGGPENNTDIVVNIVYYGKKSLFQQSVIEHYRFFFPEEFPASKTTEYYQRPQEFPQTIIAPPKAYNIRYMMTGDKHRSTALLLCSAKEPFPANSVIDFLKNRFKAEGWIELKHDLQDPENGIESPDDPNVNEWKYNKEMDANVWFGYWVDTRNNDVIKVVLSYSSFSTSQGNRMDLDVQIGYTARQDGGQCSLVEYYRRVHPEEFSTDPNRPDVSEPAKNSTPPPEGNPDEI